MDMRDFTFTIECTSEAADGLLGLDWIQKERTPEGVELTSCRAGMIHLFCMFPSASCGWTAATLRGFQNAQDVQEAITQLETAGILTSSNGFDLDVFPA